MALGCIQLNWDGPRWPLESRQHRSATVAAVESFDSQIKTNERAKMEPLDRYVTSNQVAHLSEASDQLHSARTRGLVSGTSK